jgi:hypothetical protein
MGTAEVRQPPSIPHPYVLMRPTDMAVNHPAVDRDSLLVMHCTFTNAILPSPRSMLFVVVVCETAEAKGTPYCYSCT